MEGGREERRDSWMMDGWMDGWEGGRVGWMDG